MVIVTPADFDEQPYNIPQNVDSGDALTKFIARTQARILPRILGELLYDETVDGIEALPEEWSAPADSETAYALYALVFYNDVLYQSTIAANISTPGENGDWAIVGEWVEATAYVIGEVVTRGELAYAAIADSTGFDPESSPDEWSVVFDYKWLYFRDGAAYDTKKKWGGLAAFLVPYIYSLWLEDDYQKVSGVGTVKTIPENSVLISPKRLIVNSWNDAAEVNGVCKSTRNTMYGYLQFNIESFPNYVYFDIGTMNRLSI